MTLSIENFVPKRLEATASVLASAFVTNPLHVSAFGPAALDLNRLFFRIGVQHMFMGHTLVAIVDDEMKGFVHYAAWPQCLPPPEQLPTMVASMFEPLGAAVPDLINWFSTWSRLDPEEPHVHLGPIGVTPTAQGQGIGTALMTRYTRYLDEQGAAGYLETDRVENVDFYKRFGFAVVHSECVIGMPTWQMWRPVVHDTD